MYEKEEKLIPGIDYGYMTCDSGNMFGGKTEELMAKVKRMKIIKELRETEAKLTNETIAPLEIEVFFHPLDDRYSNRGEVVSHSGLRMPAIPAHTAEDLKRIVNERNINVVAIDEIQFYQEKDANGKWSIVRVLEEFLQQDKYVIVAGLEKDFLGHAFGPIGDIMAIADEKQSHKSICTVCYGPATIPQRLVNGEPAFEDDPIIMVGAKDSYEPRCRRHHVVRKRTEAVVHNSVS